MRSVRRTLRGRREKPSTQSPTPTPALPTTALDQMMERVMWHNADRDECYLAVYLYNCQEVDSLCGLDESTVQRRFLSSCHFLQSVPSWFRKKA